MHNRKKLVAELLAGIERVIQAKVRARVRDVLAELARVVR